MTHEGTKGVKKDLNEVTNDGNVLGDGGQDRVEDLRELGEKLSGKRGELLENAGIDGLAAENAGEDLDDTCVSGEVQGVTHVWTSSTVAPRVPWRRSVT